MNKPFPLVFDDVMVKQMRKAGKNKAVRDILVRMLDRIELLGPLAGELVDSNLFIYEMKNKHPPMRMYYKHNVSTGDIYVFGYEMKTSGEKQRKTIDKIRSKISKP